MPTYSYACTACDNRFDVHQAFTDDALTECPRCSGQVRKLFGSVGIVFKGSGFYRTDSRGASGSGTAAGAKGDSTSTTSPSTSDTSSTSSSTSSTGSSTGSKSKTSSKASTSASAPAAAS